MQNITTNRRKIYNTVLTNVDTCENCNTVLNISQLVKIKDVEDSWQNSLMCIHCPTFLLSQHSEDQTYREEFYGQEGSAQ